jgi:hypothetical protein
MPIQVALRSKVHVCDPLIARVAGSNYAESMDIYLLSLLCVVWIVVLGMKRAVLPDVYV